MRRTSATRASKPPPPPGVQARQLAFMLAAGVFFLIVVIKLGNPIILDDVVLPPHGWGEILVESWQVKWGYLLMAPVSVAGLFAIRLRPWPSAWPVLLPVLWLVCECISATASVAPRLTGPTLAHFTACVVFFYLGLFALRGVKNPWPIWAGLAMALCWTMHTALEQHFGGLAATRQMIHEGKGLDIPAEVLANPDYVKRLNSDRVFGTFLYPNSFAGCILMLLPLTLIFVWQAVPKLRRLYRGLFVAILAECALACLYWSGSKAAWVLMAFMGVLAAAYAPMSIAWKRTLIYGLLAAGLVGFTIQYANSVARGKTSMVARIVYWKAAIHIFEEHPFMGSGPGTFQVEYAKIKSRDAEMARLTHNDYLEQASDSGIIGFLTFSGMILTSLICLYRYRFFEIDGIKGVQFAVYIGLLGLFLHSCMEFHLYYPALAWPAFFLLGWLWSFDDKNSLYR